VAGRLSSRHALAALCVFTLALGAWNALKYSPYGGYDATDHLAYANGLVPGWKIPHNTGEYYQPPGFYFVAGSLDWVAQELGAGEPHRAAMALDVLFLVGTVLLTWRIARDLWPEREWLAIAAAAFVAFLPRTVEMAAMFQPETMATFFCTLALWLGVRTFADRRYAVALGVALGVAQLVIAASLWTVAAVAVALALGRRWRELGVALALAIVIPLPWYVHQQLTYSGLAPFPRPATRITNQGGTVSGNAGPLWDRRPAAFYYDLGLPDVLTNPYRQKFDNLAIPTTYTELWGDYFAYWSWKYKPDVGVTKPTGHERTQLEIQSFVGLVPTLLALLGWLALLVRRRRSLPRLAVALVPLFGLLGYAYFVVAYPTSDGNVLKASYMLTATAGWALGFGYALDRLRGRALAAVVALLVVSALVELPFLFYG
jgi:4-amino-4-deoxy-L-arabinose transferase-like glycosyltransferase